ncbi:MAG: flagellar assembly protein FliW [Candidatus Eisenbacteria bacterium]|uniref:Flagellar assembly factor FliW n=1 Tax=Eiseniibacteriota bacterium TaxID=2212470 RepID=A0A937X7G3_UNCEI|nr:flagellar assembly protein FliW [Candidatus Eisenbacteria bacterium]
MRIETRHWGIVEIPDDQVIHMPEGLLGFEDLRRFVLLDLEESRPFAWLLSADDPEISFAVADPRHFRSGDYPLHLSAADEDQLDLTAGDQPAVLVIAAVDASGRVTGNLRGPIVLNTRNRIARQLVTYGSSLPLRQPILTAWAAPEPGALPAKSA